MLAENGPSLGLCAAPEKEGVRQGVNTWIPTSGECDGVIDFDALVG
jgi:hypothetical protein